MNEAIINSKQALEAYKTFLDQQFEQHKYLHCRCKTGKQRTLNQNAALHLYFRNVAESLNDAGFDMRSVLKEGVEIPWDEYKVKSDIWGAVQQVMTKKKSTSDLTKNEVSEIYEVINRHLSSRFGIFIPFPHKDDL